MTIGILDKPKIKVDERPVKLLHESCFWDEEDPRWTFWPYRSNDNGSIEQTAAITGSVVETYHDICLDVDSYIFVFSGRRGAGKTTSMTDEAGKAAVIYPEMRLLSNYPIEFDAMYIDGHVRHIKAETLDLYKLLCFDDEYKNCLICIDEAPDIISHMAAMTWKNRLLNIFIRQLRKNRNSLMLGAQDFNLIDKSMRWQVDIRVECEDASRKYGWPANTRGELILQKWLDNSGMWTGQTWQDQEAMNKARGIWEEAGELRELYPRFLWSDEKNGGHRSVYDTYYMQDVWESLKKVDMHLDSYQVGTAKDEDKEDEETGASPRMVAMNLMRKLVHAGVKEMPQKELWKSMGKMSASAKNALSRQLISAGLNNGLPTKGRDRMYGFESFDLEAFIKGED